MVQYSILHGTKRHEPEETWIFTDERYSLEHCRAGGGRNPAAKQFNTKKTQMPKTGSQGTLKLTEGKTKGYNRRSWLVTNRGKMWRGVWWTVQWDAVVCLRTWAAESYKRGSESAPWSTYCEITSTSLNFPEPVCCAVKRRKICPPHRTLVVT